MSGSNSPPADELAAVRDQIAALKKRETELRTLMLTDPSARTGNSYVAELVTIWSHRVDIKELRAMHPELVEQFTFPDSVERLELRLITDDGEITRRPKRKAE